MALPAVSGMSVVIMRMRVLFPRRWGQKAEDFTFGN